jgi:hypothetical protein
MSADAHDWRCSRSALTGLAEAGSCEQLLVQADRMMLLRCLGQSLTEKTPIPARSGGPTDASPGLHRRHCGAIKSLEGELMALRCGAMPLLGTWMALWQPFCEKWGVMDW